MVSRVDPLHVFPPVGAASAQRNDVIDLPPIAAATLEAGARAGVVGSEGSDFRAVPRDACFGEQRKEREQKNRSYLHSLSPGSMSALNGTRVPGISGFGRQMVFTGNQPRLLARDAARPFSA